MEDSVDLGGDREFHVVFAGQGQEGGGGPDAFGDHAGTGDDLYQSAAFAEFNA